MNGSIQRNNYGKIEREYSNAVVNIYAHSTRTEAQYARTNRLSVPTRKILVSIPSPYVTTSRRKM